jgi:hypothetical protein
MTGRYVTTKYCQSQAQQDEAAWAAQTTWRLLGDAAGDLATFIKEGETVDRAPFDPSAAGATVAARPRTLAR